MSKQRYEYPEGFDLQRVELELVTEPDKVEYDDREAYFRHPKANRATLMALVKEHGSYIPAVLANRRVITTKAATEIVRIHTTGRQWGGWAANVDEDIAEAVLARTDLPVEERIKVISWVPHTIKKSVCTPEVALAALKAEADQDRRAKLLQHLMDGTNYSWTADLFDAVYDSTSFRRKRNEDTMVRVLQSFMCCLTPPACAKKYASEHVYFVPKLDGDRYDQRWQKDAQPWAIDLLIQAAIDERYVGLACSVMQTHRIKESKLATTVWELNAVAGLARNAKAGPELIRHLIEVYRKALRSKGVSGYDTAAVAQNLANHPDTPPSFASDIDLESGSFALDPDKPPTAPWPQEAWVVLWNRMARTGSSRGFYTQKNLMAVLHKIREGKDIPQLALAPGGRK